MMKIFFRIIPLTIISIFVFALDGAGQVDPPKSRLKKQRVENGSKFLKEANNANGGVALDNLKTLRLIGKKKFADGTVSDLKVLVDLNMGKVRYEIQLTQNHFLINQLEKEKGWIYSSNLAGKEVIEVSPNRIELLYQLKEFLDSGVFKLRSESLKKTSVVLFEIDSASKVSKLRVSILGKLYDLKFDKNKRLIFDQPFREGRNNVDDVEEKFYSDFKTIEKITLPLRKTRNFRYPQNALTNVVYDWSLIEVNPKLTDKDWEIPSL